jgi:hypothetical protein
VQLDGTLVPADRNRAIGPTAKVDLWWSGKHHHHGGTVQVVTAPDGWPLWVSPVRPGREHDVTCARAHPGLLDALVEWTDPEHVVLADLGYLGEADRLTCLINKPAKPERTVNMLHSATRALAERGNSLFKTTSTALRRVRSVSVRGGSARSPRLPSSCSTPNTTGPHDLPATDKGSVRSRWQISRMPPGSMSGNCRGSALAFLL